MEAQCDCGLCVLCQEGENEIGIVKVVEKGLATLLEYCRLKLKHDSQRKNEGTSSISAWKLQEGFHQSSS